MELRKLERLIKKRGLLPKKYFVYEKSTIFIDTGHLIIYIPSSLSIPSPDKNSRVIGIEPADTPDTVNDLEFKQLIRIIHQNSEIDDVAIMKNEKIYTGLRQRVWRSSRRSSLQMRILIDLNEFLKNSDNAGEHSSHLELVPPRLEEAGHRLVVGPPLRAVHAQERVGHGAPRAHLVHDLRDQRLHDDAVHDPRRGADHLAANFHDAFRLRAAVRKIDVAYRA